jgi:hypothetical protein
VVDVISAGVPYIKMAVANLVGYNLLGDPELNIWTNIPKKINFDYSVVNNTNYRLNIKVTNNVSQIVKNARVCIYNNDVYKYEITNDSGIVQIDLDPRTTGELGLVITAHNHQPVNTTLNYVNSPPKFGIINDITLDEDTMIEDYVFLELYTIDKDNDFNDLIFSISNITDENSGVRIDNNNRIDIKPYTNWFGTVDVTISVFDGYDHAETQFKVTVNPVNDKPEFLGIIPKQKAKVGKSFEYQFEAEDIDNENLVFSDNTKIFDINRDTGKIKFKPKEGDIGTHNIIITVSDGNKSTNTTFIIEISKDYSFIELYWFPIAVVIITIIIIIGIRLYSKKQSDNIKKQEEKEREDKEKKFKKGKKKKKSSKK